jgi:hypothetical protein
VHGHDVAAGEDAEQALRVRAVDDGEPADAGAGHGVDGGAQRLVGVDGHRWPLPEAGERRGRIEVAIEVAAGEHAAEAVAVEHREALVCGAVTSTARASPPVPPAARVIGARVQASPTVT